MDGREDWRMNESPNVFYSTMSLSRPAPCFPPPSTQIQSQTKQGYGYHWLHIALGLPVLFCYNEVLIYLYRRYHLGQRSYMRIKEKAYDSLWALPVGFKDPKEPKLTKISTCLTHLHYIYGIASPFIHPIIHSFAQLYIDWFLDWIIHTFFISAVD